MTCTPSRPCPACQRDAAPPCALRLCLRTAREASMEALERYIETFSDPLLEHLVYGSHHAATALVELLDRQAAPDAH
jgi:hypothetical protein